MRSCLRIFATFMVVCLCASTNSEAGLIIRPDSDYVAYGATFDGVGYVERFNGGYEFGGSGVLVNQNWVLMSAHEVYGTGYNYDSGAGSFRFGTGSNYFTNPGEKITASEFFINPTYGGNAGQGYDLALLHLDNPVTTVAPVNLYNGTVANGMDSTIVGYGFLSKLDESTEFFTGDRRAGDNAVTELERYAPNYANSRLYDRGGLQMGGIHGDSGGAFLINNELAGIISTSTQGYYGTGHRTAYSLLDYDWINTTIASHPSTSVPEPTSFVLLVTTIPWMLFTRRKRTAA